MRRRNDTSLTGIPVKTVDMRAKRSSPDCENQTVISSVSIICPSIPSHFSESLSPEKVTCSYGHSDDICIPALLFKIFYDFPSSFSYQNINP
jgi:hypothetical protein